MLSAHSDWLARRLTPVASTIHLPANGEKQNGLGLAFFAVLLDINQILDRLIIQIVWYTLKE